MSLTSTSNVLSNQYPMGPKLRSWLGISESDYLGATNEHPSAQQVEAFQERLMSQMEDVQITSGDALCDLLEELVGMNMPLLAIKLVDSYPTVFLADDFRSNLHLGNACMLVSEFARAEECFRTAQKLVPEEPAPYVNLVQIYCQDRHMDTALSWALAGLDADPNFFRLWELLAWIYQQQDFSTAKDRINAEAKARNSWAGTSLAVDLASSGDEEPDPRAKMIALEPFYNAGERDYDFLVEYTAALGLAGLYEKIPAILWQVERQASKGLPWQLYFHVIQAYLGLSRDDQALEVIEKVSKMDGIPPQAREQLEMLTKEALGKDH